MTIISEVTEEEKLIKDWNDLNNFPREEQIFRNGDRCFEYSFREELKSIAWRLVSFYEIKKNYHKCAFFLLNGVITSHYHRAREHIENSKKYRSFLKKIKGSKYSPGYALDIDDYVRHWIWANGDRRDLFNEEVVKELKNNFHYSAEKSEFLPKGMTCYQFIRG